VRGKVGAEQGRGGNASERAQTKTYAGADANTGAEDERKEADSGERSRIRHAQIRLDQTRGGVGRTRRGGDETKPKPKLEQRREVGLY
jgi:hypothetical protein